MMDSSVLVNEDEPFNSHFSRSQSLEMAFQEALRNTDLIVKDEGSRRLRLRILMLENENDDLHEQLALGDDRIDLLEQECEDLRSQLDQAHEEASRRDNDARLQARELNNLKAELESMNGITTDSTKLLKEKLAITRELASLKPELEHLRTQASYQQSVLGEKLALERQVSTLEVELEAEKRALKHATQKNNSAEREAELQRQVDEAQADLSRAKREGEKAIRNLQKELDAEQKSLKRVAQKLNSGPEKEAELQQQLEEARRELAREICDTDRIRKDVEKVSKASEAREAAIESKLDQMRAKLRSTKEQLKECQTDLAQARAVAVKSEPAKLAKNTRKRTAREMSTDDAIGTPDGVAARGKRPSVRRGRIDQTAVGEKSMFSITPYLNRTVNMATDTPGQVSEQGNEEAGDRAVAKLSTAEPPSRPGVDVTVSSPSVPQQIKKKAVMEKASIVNEVLEESKASVKNRKPSQKRPRIVSTLENVTEEADENEQPQQKTSVNPKIPVTAQANKKQLKSVAQNSEVDDGEQKKKKRKLLGTGKTLFDEEDGESFKRPAKIALGPSRSLGRGGLAGLKSGLKPGLAAASAFGTFSPLKKDRRGIGASFLG